ncbi:SLBB domain-containing protein [Niabella insulamsoli]|uniref:SLBB domain-containing protein n=1 Tax=Niabella insulamsoli TaxID=3144874 RepID=UPI0031FC8710
MKLKSIFLLAFSSFLMISGVAAQTEGNNNNNQRNQGNTTKQAPAGNDLGGVNVDNMSDAQVRDVMKRMNESGFSESQLEAAAKARGMDAIQVQKFKERAMKLRNQQTEATPEDTEAADPVKEKGTGEQEAMTAPPRNSRIFGAQMFSTAFSSFEPNMRMATPANYVIGPDDELLLDLTGDNEVSYKLTVSPEGSISVEYIGRIAVGGLTIEQAKSKIKAQMDNTYPSLRTGRTQLALNLGNIRSIKVIISGEVMKPGTYTLPSVSSVFNALYNSGGPNDRGSFRNIQVIRGNQVIATVDLYDFLINGIQQGNIRLQDQDVIHIPVYQIHVDVVGEVKRSAIYEIRPDESLVDVLRYAGGFSDLAYKARVKIVQNTANAQKIVVAPLAEFPNFMPKNGDKVFVDAIFDRFENKVEINGAVSRPGMFEYKPGLTLSQLIQQADGLTPDVFMSRGYIIRVNPDNTNAIVSFDVAEVMKGGAADLALQKDDMVQISSIFDLRDEYTVSIGGEVRKPGAFSFAENMRVEELIQMAGGFKEGGSPMNIEISRRLSGTDLSQEGAPVARVMTINVNEDLSLSDSGVVLEPFDIVSVRAASGYTPQQQIQVLGEVMQPGVYTIQSKNERISDIIKRAGGLTAFAFAQGASLKRPTPLAIDATEEQIRAKNLSRLRQVGASDSTTQANIALASEASDLVGIQLDKILDAPQSRYDLVVEDGDIIRIPTLLQTVKVTGEVLRPISVVYEPGRPFKYYINSAGGFTANAHKRGSFISRPNGAVQGTTKALFFNNYPSVTPGAEISVPQRAQKERLSAQAWVGIGTGIASLAALIFAILK